MAIDTAELFTRLGRYGRLLVAAHAGQAELPAAFLSLYAEMGAAYPDLDGSVAAQEDASVRGLTGWWGTPAAAARELIFRTLKADNPAAARTFPEALAELRRQMDAFPDTVKACTVTASAAALSGSVGTGVVVLSTKNGYGLALEHLVAEAARLVCSADSYTGGATAGREGFAFAGEPQEAGVYDYDYPTGSGASAGLSAVSADEDGSGSGNLLTNGDFETWSGSPLQAENWATANTWATHLVQSGTGFRGSYSLRFPAGVTLTTVYQQFNSTSTTGSTAGTSPTPEASRSYAVNLWLRTVTGTAGAGVLTVELVDDAGAATADGEGVTNAFTIDLTALSTTWTAANGVFRLPAAPPATLRLRLRVSTALSGADVLVDDVCLTPMVNTYPGGPRLAVFAGATPFQAGDGWTVTTTNDRGGADNGATWQTLFLRLTGDPTFMLPSTSGVPTLPDDLITNP